MQNPSRRMRPLLASDLLPTRAGQPVRALVHIYFAELAEMDAGSALQDTWIEEYRARWAAHRAAASVGPGDGGAWLDGGAARAAACDAMVVPVVTADIDPAAVEDLIAACVQYHRARARAAAGTRDGTGTRDRTRTRDGTGTPDGPGGDGSAAIPASHGLAPGLDQVIWLEPLGQLISRSLSLVPYQHFRVEVLVTFVIAPGRESLRT
jgi:hypothetical protein